MANWVECKVEYIIPPCPKCGEGRTGWLIEEADRDAMTCILCDHTYPGTVEVAPD